MIKIKIYMKEFSNIRWSNFFFCNKFIFLMINFSCNGMIILIISTIKFYIGSALLRPVILFQTYERLAPGELNLRHHSVYTYPSKKLKPNNQRSVSLLKAGDLTNHYTKLHSDVRDNEVS